MMARSSLYVIGMCYLFFILGNVPVYGANASAITSSINSETITPAFLQKKIESLNARQGLDDAMKNAVLKLYQSAQDNVTSSAQFQANIIAYTASIHEAPRKTKALQKEIEQQVAKLSKPKNEDFRHIPVEELEQRLILEKGHIGQLDEQMNKIETDLALQNNRPMHIREETVAAQQAIEATLKKLQLPPASSESKIETDARQIYYKTLIDMRNVELKLLDVEAISQPARLELLKSSLQLLDSQKSALSPVVATIESLVFELRQQEAQKMEDALSQTENELSTKHPVIQRYTRENIQYSRDLQVITTKIEQISDQKTQIESQNSDIETEFKSADKKIRLAGLSPALGKILREQRHNLLTQNDMAQASRTLQNETAQTSLAQFKVEDQQKQLLTLDDTLKQIMTEQVDSTMPVDERMMIQAQLRVLLNNQKELLNKLALADATYLHTLGDLDFARQQMLMQATKFAAYLDERLLWVPSSEPLNTTTLAELYHSVQWLLSPTNALVLVSETALLIWHEGLLVSAGVGLLLLLFWLKQWTQENQPTRIDVRQRQTDHFYFTLNTILARVFSALPIPMSAFLLGCLLTNSAQEFTLAMGTGLKKAAISWFILQFCYRIFALDGLARKHFQWQKSTVILLQNQFYWLRFVIVPAMFFIYATSVTKVSAYSDSLGRLSLIVLLCAMAFFFAKCLHPTQGLWQSWLRNYAAHWLVRLRHLCYIVVICVPVIIMGFAIAGYYLSALELQEKVIATLRLMMLAVMLHQILFRWLTLVNRQLTRSNAFQERDIQTHPQPHLPAGSELPILPQTPLLDIPKINTQTRQLLHVMLTLVIGVGFWMIWKNILPAFSFLDDIVLWEHKVIVDSQESYQPITLTNLLLAGIYLFVATISIHNFSSVLELFVFRHWRVEAGSRYAVNQLAHYFLITLAFILIANELGGSWLQVQWLVAALGVGLGFGLQEIFANLVSGIILLFERPIRVGDIVTIGDITGKVARIQMRATTLIDGDQRELIVPNKTFITSQLVNWTLSDSTTRIVIPIGIAFGTNVDEAHDLILNMVKAMPLVLSDPEPCVLFVGFGDSALNFSIRVFVSDPIQRWPVINDLNIALERILREHNIEIPYPQREVRVRP
ncbi:MAG: potassium-dependent mechanosensitive channel, partial [Pseudomonadota bacterium]|nr:potassium-dependent mechanosensitive channel [Pseudomonadota bacterium]